MMATLAIEAVAFVIAIIMVPETLSSSQTRKVYRDESTPLVNRGQAEDVRPTFQTAWTSLVARLKHLSSWAAKNKRLIVVLTSMLAFHIGEQSDGTILLLYTSKRLGWSLAKASA